MTRLLQFSLSGHGRVSVKCVHFELDLFPCLYTLEHAFFYSYPSAGRFLLNHHLHCLKSQLICTVTPASSNSEETHNTLKFAHRAKHIEIQASQNKVVIFLRLVVFVVIYLATFSGILSLADY